MDLSETEINKTLQQLGRKMGHENASKLLSALGRDKQFLNAVETPVGQELLKDAVSSIEDKLVLWLQNKATDEDRAETKAYLSIINKWQATINRYYKNKEKFTKSVV